MYIPWLPHLTSLYEKAKQTDSDGGTATLFLTALLASIALDTPSERLTQAHRQLRADLQNIVYHAGQNVLFTLPKHVDTVNALVLIHGYRPLSLIHSRQAAAHTLSGKLYPTLIDAVQRQLSFNRAPAKLRQVLDGLRDDDPTELATQSLQWCSTLSFKMSRDLEDAETQTDHLDRGEKELQQSLSTVAIAIDRGLVSNDLIFTFHVIRYHTDYITTMRNLATNWNNLPKMTAIIDEYELLCTSRKKDLDRHLSTSFYSQGERERGLVLAQVSNMELNQWRTNALGLSMFFAIVYGAEKVSATGKAVDDQTVQLNKYYSDALQHEVRMGPESKSDVRKFLDMYGDAHMDGLERRLTDFINVASEVRLNGVPFVGPARHTTSNILMACKEIVENNAVRIKLDKELHHRVDVQLILFQEAARRLEAMEADGGSSEAVARGSIFAASAKLVRSLHRIMSQWKRNHIAKEQQAAPSNESHRAEVASITSPLADSMPSMSSSADYGNRSLQDDFLTDWQNWPHLDAVDFPSLFSFDFDSNGL